MRIVVAITLVVLLSACTVPETEEDTAARTSKKEKQITLNVKLFKECMELAAMLPEHANDADNNIVDDCDTRAYWRSLQ